MCIYINGCGLAVTGVNVKIIRHPRGSSHERGTQDGLRFCTLHEFLLPRLLQNFVALTLG